MKLVVMSVDVPAQAVVYENGTALHLVVLPLLSTSVVVFSRADRTPRGVSSRAFTCTRVDAIGARLWRDAIAT